MQTEPIAPTVLLKRSAEMDLKPLPNCHDGEGVLDWTIVLTGNERPGQKIRVHDDILPPGVTIGEHNAREEEHYYILSGEGTMILNGERHPIRAGDIAVVWPGGSHGLENTGTEDMRIIVIIEVR